MSEHVDSESKCQTRLKGAVCGAVCVRFLCERIGSSLNGVIDLKKKKKMKNATKKQKKPKKK